MARLTEFHRQHRRVNVVPPLLCSTASGPPLLSIASVAVRVAGLPPPLYCQRERAATPHSLSSPLSARAPGRARASRPCYFGLGRHEKGTRPQVWTVAGTRGVGKTWHDGV
jgi:hypothetical protein